MAKLPVAPVDVAKLAKTSGWSGWQLVNAVAVAKAESNHDGYAINVVGTENRADGTTNPAYRSLDVGLFQINTYWHPTLTLKDALDPTKNAAFAFKLWKSSFDKDPTRPYSLRVVEAWNLWVAYSSGAHEQHKGAAYEAVKEAGLL